jgi:hypothetical protein
MKLTTKEIILLEAIANNEYMDSENPVLIPVWTSSVNEDLEIPMLTKKSSIPGVYSSAVKKGLIYHDKGKTKNDDTVCITPAGWNAYKEWEFERYSK